MNVASVPFEDRNVRGYMGTGDLLVMLDDLPDIFPGERPTPEFVAAGFGPIVKAQAVIDALECDPRTVRRSHLDRLELLAAFLDDEGPLREAAEEAGLGSDIEQLVQIRESMAD